MGKASRDNNFVTTLLGTLDSNGTTLIPVKANPSTHALLVDDNTSGSDNGPVNAPRDVNFVPALMAVSSLDGVTPVVVYADTDGNLLIDSS